MPTTSRENDRRSRCNEVTTTSHQTPRTACCTRLTPTVPSTSPADPGGAPAERGGRRQPGDLRLRCAGPHRAPRDLRHVERAAGSGAWLPPPDADSNRTSIVGPDGGIHPLRLRSPGALGAGSEDPASNLYLFSHDAMARRVSVDRSPIGITTTYSYDAASRLTRLTHGRPPPSRSTTPRTLPATAQRVRCQASRAWATGLAV